MVHEADSDVRSRLSANLRRLRVASHMSLSSLARATAMSKATLSGIERCQGNPTIDTLAALAAALDAPISELLAEPQESEVSIVRASAAEPSAGGVARRALERAELLGGTAELAEIVLPARHLREEPPQPPGSRRRALVLDGKLIAGPSDRISELVAGDYISFPADVPHVYETQAVGARALVLTHAPRGER